MKRKRWRRIDDPEFETHLNSIGLLSVRQAEIVFPIQKSIQRFEESHPYVKGYILTAGKELCEISEREFISAFYLSALSLTKYDSDRAIKLMKEKYTDIITLALKAGQKHINIFALRQFQFRPHLRATIRKYCESRGLSLKGPWEGNSELPVRNDPI